MVNGGNHRLRERRSEIDLSREGGREGGKSSDLPPRLEIRALERRMKFPFTLKPGEISDGKYFVQFTN